MNDQAIISLFEQRNEQAISESNQQYGALCRSVARDITGNAEERYKERLAKIKPLLDELFAWLETVPVSGKGKLSDAIRYALHEKPYLYTFVNDTYRHYPKQIYISIKVALMSATFYVK